MARKNKLINRVQFDAVFRDTLLENDMTFSASVGQLTDRCKVINRHERRKELAANEAALFRRVYPSLAMAALRRAGLTLKQSVQLLQA